MICQKQATRCWFACLLVVTAASGCAMKRSADVSLPSAPASFTGTELIGELKEFEQSLGGEATENFLRTQIACR